MFDLTVDKVVSKLTKIVTDLHTVATVSREKASAKYVEVDRLTTEAGVMDAEANRADRIKEKFADLLEM